MFFRLATDKLQKYKLIRVLPIDIKEYDGGKDVYFFAILIK